MIRFDQVTFSYDEQAPPVLDRVSFDIPEGEFVLVVGRTGSGKSTLLKAMNGLVPHFTGGHFGGGVTVAGRCTRASKPRDFAATVGVVGQDPLAGFVTDTVEEELAYTMEQLAIDSTVMRKRVEETLDLLGIAELRSRALSTLSGGQQQRVAIGSVLTAQPQVLVLDEPTSALDPTAAEEVLGALARLVHDLGMTAIVAEHRMERIVQFADSVLYVPGDGSVEHGSPHDVFEHASVAPPVVELGRLCGWTPLPLSVRAARRAAAQLREQLADLEMPTPPEVGRVVTVHATHLGVDYGAVRAVRDVSVDFHRGEVTALMGRNGSGKSSLLWAIQGSGPRSGGRVDVAGHDPGTLSAAKARALVGLVPQTPGDLLYHDTVAAECAAADSDAHAEPGTCARIFTEFIAGPTGSADILESARHPRDLSEGQRLALVLAITLTATPGVVLLDEPTRGLDYPAKARLAAHIRQLAEGGRTVVIATHDVEFIAETAGRAIVMAQGEIVADGTTRDIIGASPAFAPQVAKILAPVPVLTVDDVRAVL